MAEGIVEVTAGSGTKLHSWSKTVGANTVHDEFTLPGEFPYASYTVLGTSVSAATSTDHALQLMAGSSLNVRVRRIEVQQAALITAASELTIHILRLTTAGSGGTSVTPSKHDNADSASGATAQTLPSSKGTEGAIIDVLRLWPIQTYSTAGGPGGGQRDQWEQRPNSKPILIPAGTSNGIALKILTGRAGLTIDCIIEFVETNF